jgi:hypothetical protein
MRKVWTRRGGGLLTLAALAAAVVFTAKLAPAGGAAPATGCDLLTLKDVQGVLGNGFTAFPVMGTTCGYSRGEGDAEVDVVVALSEIPPHVASDSAQFLRMQHANTKPPTTVTPVAGLGAGAFYFLDSSKEQPFFQLHFAKGNRLVVMAVTREHGRKPDIDATLKLAKIAYMRLP